MPRPTIAIPGRFTESASALRYRGVVAARTLLEAVWAAGGDPHVLLPAQGPGALDWAERLRGMDGVLLPGGGDINPDRYGGDPSHPEVYDVDDVQDETDITLAQYEVIRDHVPHCEFVVYRGYQHNITDAVPERCAQELLRFLLKHCPR